MSSATQQELVPISTAQPSPLADDGDDGLVQMFERLATNKDVDVEKLERLIAMRERIIALNARAAFNGAFSRMQPEMPEIAERGQLVVKGIVRSTYAKLEDIQAAIKPILKNFGFAMRHRTEWPVDKPGIIRIVGILSHEQGHFEESTFEAPMDKSDYRSDVQSQGSTVSYGRRYTTIDVLNITTRGGDNDGAPQKPTEPAGYDLWRDGMTEFAAEGLARLQVEFQKSKREFRAYITEHEPLVWAKMKTRASAVKDGQS